jgi:hypothetical protein
MAQLMSVLLEINVNKVKKGEIEMGSALMEFIEKSPHAVPMFQRRDAAAKTEAKAEAIILILSERFKTPSARLQKQIKKVNDIEKLDELIRFSATCVSLDEFTTAFN